ncbi:Rhs family protein [Minicystis rosea]|nr:Rhs family protein [Minicystis rosea]
MGQDSRNRAVGWHRRAPAGVGAALALSLLSHHGGAGEPVGTSPAFCPLGQVDFPAALPVASAAEVGGTPGTFAVTPTGQATYRIPLDVPPGRAGMKPSLAISYVSPAGAEGPKAMGVGFALEGLGSIRRCARNLEMHGVYAPPTIEGTGEPWCLNDAYLVPVGFLQQAVGDETQEFRAVPDTQLKIVARRRAGTDAWTSFEVRHDDGRIATYGGTADSRVMAGTPFSVPVEMWLSEIRDRRDNAIRYVYENTPAPNENPAHTTEIAIQRIEYTHHLSTAAERSVEFEYEARPQQRFFAFGQERWRSKRMKTIRMKGPGGDEVRRYELSYFGNLLATADGRDLLHSLRECAGASCKIPTYFGWEGASFAASGSNAPLGIEARPTGIDLKAIRDAHADGFQWLLADVNGDGLQDIVVSYEDDDQQIVKVALAAWHHGSSPFGPLTTWASRPAGAGNAVLLPVDWNHDGAMDLVVDWTEHAGFDELDVLIAQPESTSFDPAPSGISHSPTGPGNHRLMFADLDGRGAPDAIECWNNAGMPWWYASITEDGGAMLPVQIPNGTMEDLPCSGDVLVFDVDGDGRADLVPIRPDVALGSSILELQNGAFVATDNGTHTAGTYHDTFSLQPGQIPGGQWINLLKGAIGSDTKIGSRPVVTDVNGDGRADVVTVDDLIENWESQVQPTINIHYGGGGITRFPIPPISGSFYDGFSNFNRGATIDLNADGRGDLLVPTHGACAGGNPDDLCWTAWISNPEGTGFTHLKLQIPVATTSEVGFRFFPLFHWNETTSLAGRPAVADLDGDGRDDFLLESPSGELVLYAPKNPPDRVVSVSSGLIDLATMPDVSISYGPLVDDRRLKQDLGLVPPGGSPDPLTRYVAKNDPANPCDMRRGCVAGTRQVVTGYVLATGVGTLRTYAVSYRDGRYDRVLRSFLGFGERLVLDRGDEGGTWELYDNQSTIELVNAYAPSPVTAYPFASTPRRVRRWFPATGSQPDAAQLMLEYGSQLSTTTLTNAGRTYFTVPAARRERIEQSDFLPTPGMLGALLWVVAEQEVHPTGLSLKDAWSMVNTWDEYRNFLSETSWVVGVDDVRSTTRVFDTDPVDWLIRKETSSSQCSSAMGMVQCRELARTHDVSGLVDSTRTGTLGVPSTILETTITRDTYGNPTGTLLRDGFGDQRFSCQRYDDEGVFVVGTVNAEGHTRYFQMHRGLGVATGERDPNGLYRKRQLDRFGREVYVEEPDGRWTETTYERRDVTGLTPATYHGVVTQISNSGARTEVESDRLGRPIVRRRAAPDVKSCGAWGCAKEATLVEETGYDEKGRVALVSAPYLAEGPASARFYELIEHDGYGREIRREQPWGGTITTAYDGLAATRTDALGATVYQRDGSGRDVAVHDALGNITSTVFGPFGLAWETKVTSADPADGTPIVTTAEFDAYGRRIHHLDPDRGARVSNYNGYGEVLFESDALDRTFTHAYDKLGRRVSRTDTESPNAVSVTTWTYDTAAHGIGHLASVASPFGVVTSYGYDAFGRPASTSLEVGGETFTAALSYDSAGRPETITYPADEEGYTFSTANVYDTHGYLTEVVGHLKVDGFGPTPIFVTKSLWKLLAGDTSARVHAEQFGNDVETVTTRSPASLAIEHIETTDSNGKQLQALRYDYDDVLDLRARTDDLQPAVPGQPQIGSVSERFSYDALGRLGCAQRTFETAPPSPSCDVEISYDGFGNITSKSDVGSYTYWHNQKPHAVRHTDNAGFEYDAVGNQTGRPGVVLHYAPFDLPTRYDVTGEPAIDIDYDGDQRRVRRRRDGDETISFGSLYERDYRADHKKPFAHRYFVFSPERRVAVVTRTSGVSDAPRYLHTELLGSLDVVTGPTGNEDDRLSFDAFGQPRNVDWTPAVNATPVEPFGFTGHTHDKDLGLIDMKGRIYDPRIARFLSTDPLVANPRSSQGWNRYSYVQNRPTVMIDPSGLQEVPNTPQPTQDDPIPEIVSVDRLSSRDTNYGLQVSAPCSGECSLPAAAPPGPPPQTHAVKQLPSRPPPVTPPPVVRGGRDAPIATVPTATVATTIQYERVPWRRPGTLPIGDPNKAPPVAPTPPPPERKRTILLTTGESATGGAAFAGTVGTGWYIDLTNLDVGLYAFGGGGVGLGWSAGPDAAFYVVDGAANAQEALNGKSVAGTVSTPAMTISFYGNQDENKRGHFTGVGLSGPGAGAFGTVTWGVASPGFLKSIAPFLPSLPDLSDPMPDE